MAAIAEDEDVDVKSRSLARFEPVEFDGRVVTQIEQLAKQRGLSTKRMPSGAGDIRQTPKPSQQNNLDAEGYRKLPRRPRMAAYGPCSYGSALTA